MRLIRPMLCVFVLGAAGSLAGAAEAPAGEEQTLQAAGAAVAQGNFDAACALYRDALKKKESVALHRGYGLALFARAQKVWNDTVKKVAAAGRGPGALEAQKELDKVCGDYTDAAREYQAVLRLIPDHKDFDATGHIAFCNGINYRTASLGKTQLADFIKNNKYVSTQDEEALYRQCENMLDALLRSGRP